MYTIKDIENKSIFVLNCTEGKTLRVSNGVLLLEEYVEGKNKTLTKFPFQKILAIFVIGNINITSPLIEKCAKFGIFLIVTKLSLRHIFVWANHAEANYVLHYKQYKLEKENIKIAKVLVSNKIENQIENIRLLKKTDKHTLSAISSLEGSLTSISKIKDLSQLLGIEGNASKTYFSVYFSDYGWSCRQPRSKCDMINAILDMAYTILFNFIECFLRLFGFDPYIGVYHRLWFKRKSLVCDMIEPFRCIIDRTVRNALRRNIFISSDFSVYHEEYQLKREKSKDYYKWFFDALIPYKKDIFLYVRDYYRCFMEDNDIENYPKFKIA